MTSVAPLRSIFHPLAKWTTCLQGTKLTHFFPSLVLSVCLYLMYCISVSLPWKLPFPTHVKKKGTCLSLPQKHFLPPNSKDIPSFIPPLQKTILLPTVTSLLPALFLSPQKSWQAGGTMIQEATPANFSSTRAWSLAGTQQHPRAHLQGMLVSAPGQQGSFPCTETFLVFIPLPLHERPQPWDTVGHGIQSNSSSKKVGMHLSFCLALNRWLMCITSPQGTEVENKLPSSTHYLIKKKKKKSKQILQQNSYYNYFQFNKYLGPIWENN